MAKKFWYLIRSHQAIRDKSWKANKSICIEYQTQYTIIFDGAYEMVVGEREEELETVGSATTIIWLVFNYINSSSFGISPIRNI